MHHACPRLDQPARDVAITHRTRAVQRRRAVERRPVHLSAGFDEFFRHQVVIILRGQHKSCPSLIGSGSVKIRPSRDQRTGSSYVAAGSGEQQRRPAVCAFCVHVRARREELMHTVLIATVHRKHERREAIILLQIDRGAGRHERCHNSGAIVVGGKHKRAPPAVCWDVHRGTSVKQVTHVLAVSIVCCSHESRPSRGIDRGIDC
mmetsp:Transcript_82011/g.245901  ORF Transcript_82011/g.245901 Transcript_82011/m.245901 type:complete len:205 (+) Transcript_82011:366-980(+)